MLHPLTRQTRKAAFRRFLFPEPLQIYQFRPCTQDRQQQPFGNHVLHLYRQTAEAKDTRLPASQIKQTVQQILPRSLADSSLKREGGVYFKELVTELFLLKQLSNSLQS